MPRALLALAPIVLLAHLAYLPVTLEDIDAINFALGVRDFDVSNHQPHPPGYPVFIAAAKLSTAALAMTGVAAPEVRGLAVWSAISGALLLPLLFTLYRDLARDQTVAVWGAIVTVVSPLVWFNALRPLSDVTGLAMVVAAQALLVRVILRRPAEPGASRALITGAFIAGVAIGLRSQSLVLTFPLLGLALIVPGSGIRARNRLVALAALASGALLWAVPLLIASGGFEAYLVALGNQAGEDFSGVVMLWTTRTARVAIDAASYTFLWPWGGLAAGATVVGIAVAGALRMVRRAPGSLATLLVAFVPYAIFHLLFQETLTTRYALPLVIFAAFLCVYALGGAGRYAVHAGAAVLAIWSLAVTLPAMGSYGRRPVPAVRALQDALAAHEGDRAIAMHAVMLRSEQWYHDNASGRVMRAVHGREISGLVGRWRESDATLNFIADPRRSDLARLDVRSREPRGVYEWGFPEVPLVGGVRPGEARLVVLRPPGWMLDEGWAVTAEVAGETERLGAGPHRRPSIAWIRTRSDATTLMLGGRNLGLAGAPPARIALSLDGRVIHSFAAAPGFFFETLALPAGTLAGRGRYVPLEITASAGAADGIRVGLEQFDLQAEGVPMTGVVEGWQEPEYNPTTGRTWRWMSDRATLWVRSVGRDVSLRISAESPLRYFDTPPALRVTVGGRIVSQLSPSADFTWDVKIPAHLLEAGSEAVVIESDRSFVAGGGDQRQLALRVYSIEIN
ncbi:MAG: DUF2723 domain-containing protein [Acidobacteria bacterium]|nr:DUF2723 domain-containing protein [Acidobacteriota bacterium]